MSDRNQALRAELEAAQQEALQALAGLSEQQLAASVNEGWSAKDMLAHVSSIESRIRSMCEHALASQPWGGEPSVHVYNDQCVEERRDWSGARLIDELRDTHQQTLALADRLAAADLDLEWDHPSRGRVTLERMLRIIPNHKREHAQEIANAARG